MAKKSAEDVVNLLVKALAPKKKKKGSKPNRILVIDGIISTEMVTLKEAKKIAKRYSTQDVSIDIYSKEGTLKVDLPVEVA